MTERYLRSITADYITGVVSACEGIHGSLVLLNGPLGCRFYHSYAFGKNLIRESELWGLRGELQLSDAMDDRLVRSQYFAGTPQIPGSNLRYEDYIFGTGEQLERALRDILAERRYSMTVVIQTPGTSLMGEGLESLIQKIAGEFQTPSIFVESPEFSTDSCAGYDETMARLLKQFVGEKAEKEKEDISVNLFGFCTYQQSLEGDTEEIRRLLGLCGIRVKCIAGADCTLESFRKIPEADLNILCCPERCEKTEAYLREVLKLPVYDAGGFPIGFDQTEKFVKEVSERLHTDCRPALADLEKARARAFYYMARYLGQAGFPEELRYAAEEESSLLCGYVDYLSGYLGIRPEAVRELPAKGSGNSGERLHRMLKDMNAEEVLGRDITRVNHAVILGSAGTIMETFLHSDNVYGIETMGGASEYIHVVPKTYLGSTGALYLLEQLLNGNRMLKAWK